MTKGALGVLEGIISRDQASLLISSNLMWASNLRKETVPTTLRKDSILMGHLAATLGTVVGRWSRCSFQA